MKDYAGLIVEEFCIV